MDRIVPLAVRAASTFPLVNFSLDDADPRLAAVHWFTDEQVEGMRSFRALARRGLSTGGRP
jgi:hypothetical protein